MVLVNHALFWWEKQGQGLRDMVWAIAIESFSSEDMDERETFALVDLTNQTVPDNAMGLSTFSGPGNTPSRIFPVLVVRVSYATG